MKTGLFLCLLIYNTYIQNVLEDVQDLYLIYPFGVYRVIKFFVSVSFVVLDGMELLYFWWTVWEFVIWKRLLTNKWTTNNQINTKVLALRLIID